MIAETGALWPLLLYAALVITGVAFVLALSHALGQRHSSRAMREPFESGITPTGLARQRFSAHFYMVAVFFVIFDLEAVFLFTWAIAWREVGWAGYIEMLVFVGVLLAALFYLWRSGALDWAAKGGGGRSRRLPNPGRTATGGEG